MTDKIKTTKKAFSDCFLNVADGTEWYIYWSDGNESESGKCVVIKKTPDFYFPDWMNDAIAERFRYGLKTSDGKAAMVITADFIERHYEMELYIE